MVANLRTALVLLFLWFSICQAMAGEATPQKPPPATPEELSKVFDPLMAEWIEKHKGAGVVLTVTSRDQTVFEKGYGLADVEAGRPFTADSTLARPGSISKLFTGISVMQLVDQGKLDLDRDVNDYLDFKIPTPEGGVPVTLRLLLRHRAGFEEHTKDLFIRAPNPEPLRSLLPRSLPNRIFPGGDVAAYSNYGMALAGYIVERVSGEPFDDYIAHHILEPLGMIRSTFKQPLPEALAPMMAKAYLTSEKPLGFIETIADSPAGALSATGADMARFMRALLNDGELDGTRILSQKRLQDMMAPGEEATPAGSLGLVFFGDTLAGHRTLGHDGETMAFSSHLTLFPDEGFGVFVSFDGISAANHAPNISRIFAEHFLPEAIVLKKVDRAAAAASANIAGVYHTTRRGETTFLKVQDLLTQAYITGDENGNIRMKGALWPFGEGIAFTRIGMNTFEGPRGGHLFLENTGTGSPRFTNPALEFHRVPAFEDIRFIGPALVLSVVVLLLTLLAWPVEALWRRWRKTPFSDDSSIRRMYAATRIVALLNIIVVAIAVVIKISSTDLTIFSSALDAILIVLYGLAWLAVPTAVAVACIALVFWRRRIGGLWTRVHQTLVAGSIVFLAWFFVIFHLAGTSLNY